MLPQVIRLKVSVPKLELISGRLAAGSQGFLFLCDDGANEIVCAVASDAWCDLIDFHRRNSTKGLARVLLSEIERLAGMKYNAGRFEENGGLLIQISDLLRYGSRQSAAQIGEHRRHVHSEDIDV
jgi:hypothetical protein